MSECDNKKYQETLSLIKTCECKAIELDGKLKELISPNTTICIGFHLRHVFDTTAPSVGLNKPNNVATKISEKNKKHGLQTLNHILDTLYYDNSNGNGTSVKPEDPVQLCIRIDFEKVRNEENKCHIIDKEIDEENECNSDNDGWLNCHYSVLQGHIYEEDIEHIKDFVSGAVNLPWQKSSKTINSMFHDYTCGAEKLCNDLKIPHSLSAYRVITAAIYQLGTYATEKDHSNNLVFGSQTVTLIIRFQSPFSVVVGVTIIAPTITTEIIIASKKFLLDQYASMTQKFLAKNFSGHIWGWNWIDPTSISEEKSLMAAYLWKLIADEGTDTSLREFKELLKPSLIAFVDFQLKFLGIRSEGKTVCFGFILGNPGLLTHTPREQPFPLEYKYNSHNESYKFFTQEVLPKQIHLTSMPTDRAVVLPYSTSSGFANQKGSVAAFVLEFDEAMEEFRSYPWFRLWSDQFIPYLYYTNRFPWAIASYVGPGAEIRLFARGQLVAYHNERGWLKISFTETEEYFSKQNKKLIDNMILRQLLQVSLQMSRFSNPDAKGGMLIYLAKPKTKEKNWTTLFQSLTDNEPRRAENADQLWLTGRNLIRPKKIENKESYELDYAVARTLLQAAQLDGSIVLYRNASVSDNPKKQPVTVALFGQRIIRATQATQDQEDPLMQEKNAEPKSGTRHFAAESLMKDGKIPIGSIAIAISSDGPITIWAKIGKSPDNNISVKIGIPFES